MFIMRVRLCLFYAVYIFIVYTHNNISNLDIGGMAREAVVPSARTITLVIWSIDIAMDGYSSIEVFRFLYAICI